MPAAPLGLASFRQSPHPARPRHPNGFVLPSHARAALSTAPALIWLRFAKPAAHPRPPNLGSRTGFVSSKSAPRPPAPTQMASFCQIRRTPGPRPPNPGPCARFLLTNITNCNNIITYCDMSRASHPTPLHEPRAIVFQAAPSLPFSPRAELPRRGTRTQKEYTPNL